MDTPKSFKFGKLVRDNVVDILRNEGVFVEHKTLSMDDSLLALREKVVEEANEIAEANSIEELIEEIADMREVMLAIMERMDISEEAVTAYQNEKSRSKGSFTKGLFIDSVTFYDPSDRISYFQAQPKKYPELSFDEPA